MRARLETTNERAIIRFYDAARADELEAMEAALFAQFAFSSIAREDVVRTQDGGLKSGWVMIVGWLAPTERVTFRVRAVCFARHP